MGNTSRASFHCASRGFSRRVGAGTCKVVVVLFTVVSSSNRRRPAKRDRKSTRLNSSHGYISYAVFCLKKKKKNTDINAAHHHTFSNIPCNCTRLMMRHHYHD